MQIPPIVNPVYTTNHGTYPHEKQQDKTNENTPKTREDDIQKMRDEYVQRER